MQPVVQQVVQPAGKYRQRVRVRRAILKVTEGHRQWIANNFVLAFHNSITMPCHFFSVSRHSEVFVDSCSLAYILNNLYILRYVATSSKFSRRSLPLGGAKTKMDGMPNGEEKV